MNGVVVPEQRHRVDTSLVPRLRVMGFIDGTEVRVSELDVRLSIPVEDLIDELLGGLLHGVGRNSTLVLCESPER